jgi:hypothetical protein
MGHESRIEPWSPHLTAFCFAGFGTDRLRRAKVMKTAGRENPNRRGNGSSNRAHGAEVQNRSCSIMWAGKQEKVRPLQECFFLTFLFIEHIRSQDAPPAIASRRAMSVMIVREPMYSTNASAIQSTGIISMAC